MSQNLVRDQDNSFYMTSLSILITNAFWIMYGYYREKLLVNHL